MKKIEYLLLVFILLFPNIQAESNEWSTQTQKQIVNNSVSDQLYGFIGDLKLQNGEILFDCELGYKTFGKMNEKKDNIIVFLSFFAGNSTHLGSLIGEDKIVDSTNYFIICIDALSNGISTSPSKYNIEKNNYFPDITIRDMVNAEYLLLTKVLNINSVYCMIGGSMGGMQVFEWLMLYPDFTEKAVPYLSTPQMTSFDLLCFNSLLQVISFGKESNWGEKKIQQIVDMFFATNFSTPDLINSKTKREDFPNYLKSFTDKEINLVFTVDNIESQLKACVSQNIIKENSSIEETAKQIKAKMLVIVCNTDRIVNPQPAIKFAKAGNFELVILDNNCGHGGVSCEMKKVSGIIDKFLDK